MQIGTGARNAMRNLPQRLGIVINNRLRAGCEIGSQFLRKLGEQSGNDLLVSVEHFEQGGKIDGRGNLVHGEWNFRPKRDKAVVPNQYPT